MHYNKCVFTFYPFAGEDAAVPMLRIFRSVRRHRDLLTCRRAEPQEDETTLSLCTVEEKSSERVVASTDWRAHSAPAPARQKGP